MNVDLRLLRYAVALAEHGNFVRAAKAVHISQPSMSRAIQQLEELAGTKLFERTTRSGAEPTDVGKVLLARARAVLSQAEDFGRELNLLKGLETGELRVGAGTFPASMMVETALARLISAHPSVRVMVSVNTALHLTPLLGSRDLDFAVIDIAYAKADSQFHVTPLSTYEMHLVLRARHPVLALPRERIADELWNYPLISTSRFSPAVFKELAVTALGSELAKVVGTRAVPSIGCESLYMMKNIVRQSNAITGLPLCVVIDEVKRGELVVLPGRPWMRVTIGVVRLAHRSLSPLGESFVKLLQEADAELLVWEEETARTLFQKPVKGRAKTRAKAFSTQ